ncbi:DUF1800 domain-containing protein [Amantichitinum ursilacus]|uniref:DUF1800 domain-containing protein n=1 Tax=Amantichitinum ursilacus TaxID=857265 RepID=UPI00137915A7|nr:DUF1800 domain-containing protein [Amantichitinum ursilacus]
MLTLTAALAACGGGSSEIGSNQDSSQNLQTKQETAVATVTRADAQRLLEQATFGPTEADIANVQRLGIKGWIAAQIATPATGYKGTYYVNPGSGVACNKEVNVVKYETDALKLKNCARDIFTPAAVQRQFFTNAVSGKDQLRQRVAFALSQILVTSGYEAYAQADYQNMLLNHAFDTYSNLMLTTTLHPTMGDWLDMVNNDKPNAAKGIQANENYAREFLQLFTTGTSQLNYDGSVKLDAHGKPLPVYTQAQVTAMARAFTGWTYPAAPGGKVTWQGTVVHAGQMVAIEAHHDTDAKVVLGGYKIAAGGSALSDVKAAVNAATSYPSVAPFIGKQLIQKLVTSNPTPAYVSRVSAVWNNDGAGVRGNLAAVVTAILTDPEARGDVKTASSYGRLREPTQYMISLMRTLGGTTDGMGPNYWSGQQGEAVFMSPSVFNFYSPAYVAPGTSVNGPEFGVLNTASQINRSNYAVQMFFLGGVGADASITNSIGTHIDLTKFGALTDRSAAVDKFNDLLLHGSLSAAGKAAIMRYLNMYSDAQIKAHPTMLASYCVYLISTSPQYEIQK